MQQLSVSIALNIEEILRIFIRHKNHHANWTTYPAFITACDLFLGLALLLWPLFWLYMRFDGFPYVIRHSALCMTSG
jgi:hypothetical protein